jgi:hypothetical protein
MSRHCSARAREKIRYYELSTHLTSSCVPFAPLSPSDRLQISGSILLGVSLFQAQRPPVSQVCAASLLLFSFSLSRLSIPPLSFFSTLILKQPFMLLLSYTSRFSHHSLASSSPLPTSLPSPYPLRLVAPSSAAAGASSRKQISTSTEIVFMLALGVTLTVLALVAMLRCALCLSLRVVCVLPVSGGLPAESQNTRFVSSPQTFIFPCRSSPPDRLH